MADDDKDKPPPRSPPPVPPQQQIWVPDQAWDMPLQQRNNALYDSQPPLVTPPQGLQGVAAVGQVAGEGLAPAVSNAALSGASTVMMTGRAELTLTPTTEARFEALQARVALLEAGLAALRRYDRQIGPGHNQGPAFTPIEDLSDVDDWLIALLKEKGPRPPADPTSLIEQGEKALRISERISNAAMTLGAEMAKGGAREVGKELLEWIGVGQLIKYLYLAFKDWLG